MILGMSGRDKEEKPSPSASERIRLAGDIRDGLAGLPESVALTHDQKRELDNRLKAYRLRPDEGAPWQEVRERIRKRG